MFKVFFPQPSESLLHILQCFVHPGYLIFTVCAISDELVSYLLGRSPIGIKPTIFPQTLAIRSLPTRQQCLRLISGCPYFIGHKSVIKLFQFSLSVTIPLRVTLLHYDAIATSVWECYRPLMTGLLTLLVNIHL